MYLPGQSSCHLYMTFQLLQNKASGHIKVKKVTGHVLYLAIPSHATESVPYGPSIPCLSLHLNSNAVFVWDNQLNQL